ncbi:hypothetical protein M8J76_000963 [Diaphorina citri]|nr:hypothetical protein M8J75_010513 [Diaphorina citri]KAI5729282.1 hypothetical protein M8J76_000963 [Diaphorina citri]
MELLHILLTLVVVVLGTKLFYWYRRRIVFIRTIDKIHGPPSWPLLGTVLYDLVPRDKLFKHAMARTQTFKPVYRSWTGPSAIVHLTRQKWFSHRKMITPTFHFQILETFMDTFVQKSDILTDKLSQQLACKEGFDIFPFITKCALDIICETAMGSEINAQASSESDYVRAVYDISTLVLERMMRPWLWPSLIFGLTRDGKRHEENLKILQGFTRQVIEERKAARAAGGVREGNDLDENFGKKKRVAFLDLLLEASESSETPLTDEELREEVDTFMFEGHDTTAAGLAWTLFLLGSYPEHQDKVYAELEEIFADDPGRKINSRDCAQMKYLERVIKESLRLFPSVPFIGRVLTEEVQVGEYLLPVGCMLNIEIVSLHRCADQYPNPEVFQPDNFLPENVQKRHNYSYIPFSAGPRNCIGEFALLEEKCVLASILRKFKVISLEKLDDVTIMIDLILRPASGVKVKLEPRHKIN